MIKIFHDSQFYSTEEIINLDLKLKGAIIETFDTDIQKLNLFLVIDTNDTAAYLNLETLETYDSFDLGSLFEDYNFVVYDEPYIEVNLKKRD